MLMLKNREGACPDLGWHIKDIGSMPSALKFLDFKKALKGSALYLVIIIALIVGILCSSLIATSYFYKLQFQKKNRFNLLYDNLYSGIHLLTAADPGLYSIETKMRLFEGTEARDSSLLGEDSIAIQSIPWGLYDTGIVKSFIHGDSLAKVFLMASPLDSTKWGAVYLVDENRPLSVSGNTFIRGVAFIPKAGVNEAYVDGKAYTGDKRMVLGKIKTSVASLPELSIARVKLLSDQGNLALIAAQDSSLPNQDNSPADSLFYSFLEPIKVINFKKKVVILSHIKLTGNLLILSDTTVIIDSSARLQHILLFAHAVSVRPGFMGSCQLFARDSIIIGKGAKFPYPSALGILRMGKKYSSSYRLSIGQNSVLEGAIFTYEKENSPVPGIIDIGKGAKIHGLIYSPGLVRFTGAAEIDGGLFAGRFLYNSGSTSYENYLIDTRIDASGLSPYYLSSSLFPVTLPKRKVLTWLVSK